MADVSANPVPEPLRCANHPNVETMLRCNRCDKPICTKCAVRTPVGYRCRECVSQQQAVYFSATKADYVLAVVLGAGYGALGGALLPLVSSFIPFYGWFAMLVAAPALAGGAATLLRRIIGRRRGRYLGLAVCGVVIAGSLLGLLITGLFVGLGRLLINYGIFIVLTVITLYARLR
jgi:hypothetical protein